MAKDLRKRVGSQLKLHFLTGILVVTPAVLAGWILYKFLAWVDGLLWEKVRMGWIRPEGIPGVGFVIVVLLILFVGMLVNNYVGQRFYNYLDSLLSHIPVFDKMYIAFKQIGEALLSRDNAVFREVGLIEFPRPGLWALVFLAEKAGAEIEAKTGEKLRCVFLPHTPNPTTGFLLMVPEADIRRLDLSVEKGIKMVISGGAYVPNREPGLRPARLRRRGDGSLVAVEERGAPSVPASPPERESS
jgi:uncharacterized membrane protein